MILRFSWIPQNLLYQKFIEILLWGMDNVWTVLYENIIE